MLFHDNSVVILIWDKNIIFSDNLFLWKKEKSMYAEFLSVSFLDSCKELLVVVSKLMGPSVQITAHIITLNGRDSANIRSALRNNR